MNRSYFILLQHFQILLVNHIARIHLDYLRFDSSAIGEVVIEISRSGSYAFAHHEEMLGLSVRIILVWL